MSDLEFARAWLLAFSGFPVAVLLLRAIWARRAANRLQQLHRNPARVASVAAPIWTAAAIVAILAAAGPQWGEREASLTREGADVVFAIDISRSMDAQDLQPSRLAAARETVTATLDGLTGHRAGVVVFGGSGRLRFPLTTDLDGAAAVVSSLETGSILVDAGTSADSGLGVAREALASSEAGRLVVLVTDGDDLGGDPIAAASRLRADGIGLLVVATGTTDGATIPVIESANDTVVDKIGPDGVPIVSRVDDDLLARIAQAGGGAYLGANLDTLPGAVRSALGALDRASLGQASAPLPVERFQWFAASALLLAAAAAFFEYRPARRLLLGLAGAALVVLPGCATRAYDLDADARAAHARGDLNAAIDFYHEARAEDPGDPQLILNLAAALHDAGRYSDATRTARQATGDPSSDIRNRAHASIGHHRFRLGDLPGALDAFRAALVEDPDDDASRHDFEVVQALIDARETDRPPALPGAGEGALPSDGDPLDEADPNDSETPGDAGDPSSGDAPPSGDPDSGNTMPPDALPTSAEEIDRLLSGIDAELAALTEATGDEISASEALAILDLVEERNRIAALRNGITGSGAPDDY